MSWHTAEGGGGSKGYCIRPALTLAVPGHICVTRVGDWARLPLLLLLPHVVPGVCVCVGSGGSAVAAALRLGTVAHWHPLPLPAQTVEFRLYRGKPPLYPTGQLMGVSNPVSWRGGPLELYQPRAAFAAPAHEAMYFSWTTSSSAAAAQGLVQARRALGGRGMVAGGMRLLAHACMLGVGCQYRQSLLPVDLPSPAGGHLPRRLHVQRDGAGVDDVRSR